jgi:hypothetical protein
MPPKHVFINYRRDDSGYAGRIYDRLHARFPGQVIMDVAGIQPGVDFNKAIRKAVRTCDAFVAIIGRYWLSSTDAEGRRRIDREDDFVRMEIATALSENISLIPVLVRGASMPRPEELPADLQPLTRRNALEITDTDFDVDINRLIQSLAYILGDEHPSPAGRLPLPKEVADAPDSGAEADFVFVSYDRSDDEEFALQLAGRIKEHGVKVWVDQWDLEPSEDWDRRIDEALNGCARFLIVLSPSSVNSDEVRGELRFALDEKKPIVPVLYKDCTIPRRLRLTQHVDFRSRSLDDQAEMSELLKALKGRRK